MAPELSSCKLIQGCESKTLITGVWQKKSSQRLCVLWSVASDLLASLRTVCAAVLPVTHLSPPPLTLTYMVCKNIF